jgi:hypothetical protein
MNERIQQLWTQAEEEIKAEYEDESRRNRRLYNEIFLPKFAELIVRECAGIVENQGAFMRYNHLAEQIRKHFEIKKRK